ncbi:hypothetical protein BHE74_00049183 [Ensete ventricosum]|nr:hypothetical protein BHE74_00049183 [Ensete ventricosum]
MGGGAREDKVGGGEDQDAQEEKEGPGDHCVPSVRLVEAHPPKVGPEAPELIISAEEASCARCLARQQQLDVVAGSRFYNDASFSH